MHSTRRRRVRVKKWFWEWFGKNEGGSGMQRQKWIWVGTQGGTYFRKEIGAALFLFTEVEMSKLFCLNPGLRVLEKQMQEPPGYRPRGYGICIIEEMDLRSRGNYSEIVDCVISRMQLEHLKKRVEEIFGEADKEIIFHNMKHRNDFYSLLYSTNSFR